MPADESSRRARDARDAAFAAAEADEAIWLFCYLRDSEGLDEPTARARAAYIISGIQNPIPAPRDNIAVDREETADFLQSPEAVGERPSAPAYGPTQAPGDEPGEDAQHWHARDATVLSDPAADADPWRPPPAQFWQLADRHDASATPEPGTAPSGPSGAEQREPRPGADLDPERRVYALSLEPAPWDSERTRYRLYDIGNREPESTEQAALSSGLPAVEASTPVLADLYAENRQFRELDPERAAARALHTWSQVQATGRDPATALPRASDLTHDGLYQVLRQRGDDNGQALTGIRDEHLASLTEPADPEPLIPGSGTDPSPVGEYGRQPPAPTRVPGTDAAYPPLAGGFRPRSDGPGELPRRDERCELAPLGHAATTTPAADDADALDRRAADTAMSRSSDELAAAGEASLHRIDQTLARARQAIAESDTELTRPPDASPEQAVEVSPVAHAEPAVESGEACL
jgi:hypothetical protein